MAVFIGCIKSHQPEKSRLLLKPAYECDFEATQDETFAKRPFRSLRLSAQSLRYIRISILEIFNIFLRLKSSCALILNEIERFSKVSRYGFFNPVMVLSSNYHHQR
jgi:hypothetical protein